MNETTLSQYFSTLASVIESGTYTTLSGEPLSRSQAFAHALDAMKKVVEAKGRVLFCGNGGSAGICSHMATDFFKNGDIPALALNDSSALTCLGNDYGFEYVFSKQIEMLGGEKDMVLAISSSGNSQNILNAVKAGRDCGSMIVTFSGMSEDNSLRHLGDVNFHVAAQDYGFVEVAHSALIHALLDMYMGWPDIKYPD